METSIKDELYDKLSEVFSYYAANFTSLGEGDLKSDIKEEFIDNCFEFLKLK